MKPVWLVAEPGVFLVRIREWWRNWCARRNGLAELRQPTVLEFVAKDLNLSPQELHAVAAKWPNGSELLYARMAVLRLNRKQFSPAELGVLRDAERVCTLCGNKKTCKHDLASNPTGSDWLSYCPNVDTLCELQTQPVCVQGRRLTLSM